MSRWIDADALEIDILLNKYETFKGAKIPDATKEVMFAYLDSAPSIDIVRCRECKHASHWQTLGICSVTSQRVKADDFCSYGCREERSE